MLHVLIPCEKILYFDLLNNLEEMNEPHTYSIIKIHIYTDIHGKSFLYDIVYLSFRMPGCKMHGESQTYSHCDYQQCTVYSEKHMN